jgi:endonuclease/exonuclease/phosphatase family metal-dependent hydrolase
MQMRKLLGNKLFKYIHQTTPIIIGGDFNDVWGTLNRHCMQAAGFLPVSKHASTFPAFMPMRQLDNIYYLGPIKFLHSFPGRIQIARQASDHLPLVADFKISIQ